jgi:hypothetical protein
MLRTRRKVEVLIHIRLQPDVIGLAGKNSIAFGIQTSFCASPAISLETEQFALSSSLQPLASWIDQTVKFLCQILIDALQERVLLDRRLSVSYDQESLAEIEISFAKIGFQPNRLAERFD